ncbi:MAG: hypothetical protein KJ600_00415 [Nanoarchaeota archaeon]|nr:hypothetical protein [Nanoarchaeota archaeon]
MKTILEDLQRIGNALEEAFGREIYDEAGAVRNLADAGLVDGRRKNISRQWLKQNSNKQVTHFLDTKTTIAKHWKLVETPGQKYFFFRFNTALGEVRPILPAETSYRL